MLLYSFKKKVSLLVQSRLICVTHPVCQFTKHPKMVNVNVVIPSLICANWNEMKCRIGH